MSGCFLAVVEVGAPCGDVVADFGGAACVMHFVLRAVGGFAVDVDDAVGAVFVDFHRYFQGYVVAAKSGFIERCGEIQNVDKILRAVFD